MGPYPGAFSKACRGRRGPEVGVELAPPLAATQGRHLVLLFREGGCHQAPERVWTELGDGLRIYKDGGGGAETPCWKLGQEGNVTSAGQSGQVFIGTRGTVL